MRGHAERRGERRRHALAEAHARLVPLVLGRLPVPIGRRLDLLRRARQAQGQHGQPHGREGEGAGHEPADEAAGIGAGEGLGARQHGIAGDAAQAHRGQRPALRRGDGAERRRQADRGGEREADAREAPADAPSARLVPAPDEGSEQGGGSGEAEQLQPGIGERGPPPAEQVGRLARHRVVHVRIGRAPGHESAGREAREGQHREARRARQRRAKPRWNEVGKAR